MTADLLPDLLETLQVWQRKQAGGQLLNNTAPALMLPDVLDSELCRTLIQAWEKEHQEGGVSVGTDNMMDASKKRTLEHVVTDPALARPVVERLARRIGPELVKVFNFNERFGFEGLTVMSYQADRQDFFGMHRDNPRQNLPRRFAVSLNLNDNFEGGGLRFPEYGPHTYKPDAGAAVVFSCSLLHEALPLTQGQRWVLTTFFCDPPPETKG